MLPGVLHGRILRPAEGVKADAVARLPSLAVVTQLSHNSLPSSFFLPIRQRS